MSPKPYPYRHWRQLTADQARAQSRAARWLSLEDGSGLSEAFESLLGVRPRVGLVDLEHIAPAQHFGQRTHVAAVVLTSSSPGAVLVIELDPRLALFCVDRILGGPGAKLSHGALGDVERGVLAFGAASLLKSATQNWLVGAVITSPIAMVSVLGDEALAWSANVDLESDRYFARLWAPANIISRLPPWSPEAGDRFNPPIAMSVTRGQATLRRAELEDLRASDVILLEQHHDSLAVRIVGGARVTWWCTPELRIEKVERTLETAPTTASPSKDETMTEPDTDPIHVAADAPVELSVELARFTIPLQELAALRPGEVLGSGVQVGAHAQLRTADRVIARGELVDIEGDIGFRIIELLR